MQLQKTTPEQRTEIYEDVRLLLMPGFLAHPVSVNKVRLVVRSLDVSDWYVLRYRAEEATEHEWRAWVVASAIWMVNGSVIINDEDAIPLLYEMCRSLPFAALTDVHGVVMALVRRARDAAEAIEGYLYEDESRHLWRSDGPLFLSDPAQRGFLRARNPILKLWIYYNQMEDLRESNDFLWSLAKFQAGPHAPKGCKKINAQDQKRARELETRRQRTMDRTYYVAKGLIEDTPAAARSNKRRLSDVHLAETPEELQEEMRRWVAGEKDEHDNVIDGIKAKIRAEVEGRRAKEAERRVLLQKALEDEGIRPSRLVPLSGKAGQDFLDRVKARVPGVSKVMQDNTHNSAYEKYIARPTEVGVLRVDDSGRVTSDLPTDEKMLEMMRKRQPTDPDSLQQQIENRRPTVTFVDDDGEED